MRLFKSVLATAAIFLAASTASAVSTVTFVVNTSVASGNPLNALVPGDEVTLNIRLAKSDSTTLIFAVGGAIQDYNSNIMQFVTGAIGLDTTFFATNAARTNGLGNAIDASLPLVEGNAPGVGPFVQIVNAVATTGKAGNGSLDAGIDGVVGGGDAQFRVVFRALAPGTTAFNIGTTTNITLGNVIGLAGGVAEQANNGLVSVTVVPEPGTALLMGLGLAGLAAAGRRQ